MAAITATQAAIQQQQLRFSRAHEREADRIGMVTLVEAGYDANGMPRMFSRMMESLRYAGQRPPEFLLSHPVTENRVADSQNRARNYAGQGRVDSEDFALMRARVQLGFDQTPGFAIKRFRAEIEKDGGASIGNVYGLALAQTRADELDAARSTLAPLLENHPDKIAFAIAAADIDLAAGKPEAAARRLRGQLDVNPGNHPLTMAYANALLRNGKPRDAERVLEEHSRRKPDDPQVWYELAETHGLAGNIIAVHRARAEYFILNGALDLAERQLGYALDLARSDFHTTASVQARIADIRAMREEIKL
jgi:predicted Zn-dependent protease